MTLRRFHLSGPLLFVNHHRLSTRVAVVLFGLAACTDAPGPAAPGATRLAVHAQVSQQETRRHLVVFAAEQVPADFADRVATLGGSIGVSLDGIGVATVTGLTEAAAAELTSAEGIRHVEPDVLMRRPDDDVEATEVVDEQTASASAASADATASPISAQFYSRQWNMRAVFADPAWEAGHLGSRDVVVAILDTGIDYLHPDLVGLVDLERSKSLVPEDDPLIDARFPGRLPITDIIWHGTAVASIIASNGKVVAGINRTVSFIAVKIWDRFGMGTVARLLSGIVYAANQGADVINVSGGGTFDKSDNPGLVAAVERAANYAFRKGALLVGVSGNDAADLDHDGAIVRMPCEATNAICASATGPTGAAGVNGPWQNVDAVPAYSGFGRSAVDVAAPGGDGQPGQFRRVWLPCTTTPTEFTGPPACQARQAVAQGMGTSWAAAHTSGLAALLVAQLGHGNPARIRARILQSADDLGAPGTDSYYGKGRINIARALGLP